MQSMVTLLVVGIALFAAGCLTIGLLVVGTAWAMRQIVRAIPRLSRQAEQQVRSCYNEPLSPIVEVRGKA